jgi:hypothetical protein
MGMNPRTLRPSASGFTPRSISGLAAWWDASDDATITLDTGVSVWADKSGNGRNATQSVSNNRPARDTTINGRSVLTFDGTNDSLDFTGVARTVETMFAVVQQRDAAADTANASRYGTILGAASNSRGLLVRNQYNNDNFLFDPAFNGFTLGVNRIVAVVAWLGSSGDVPLAVYVLRRNGTSGMQGWINTTSLGTATTSESQTLDRIGRSATSTSYFVGQMAEILIYDRAILDAERLRITDYLMRRWAVTNQTYTVS